MEKELKEEVEKELKDVEEEKILPVSDHDCHLDLE